MKKLLAVALSLCLLCSFALAEETPELSWENSLSENPNLEANGSTQQIAVDGVGNILYWIPNNLPAIDVSTIEAEIPPIAAFGADNEGTSYSVSVYALTVTGGQITREAATFTASFCDMLNTEFPKLRYTAQNAPGLKYVA